LAWKFGQSEKILAALLFSEQRYFCACPDRNAFVNRMLSHDEAVMPCLHGDGG
jgi:hypothetical protein